MEKITSAKELAKKYVGDDKSKLWFVTISYGWYKPADEDSDYVQVPDSLESITILVASRLEANLLYEAFMTDRRVDKITKFTISQVMIENKTGVVRDKIYEKSGSGFDLMEY